MTKMFKDESTEPHIKQFNTPCGRVRVIDEQTSWGVFVFDPTQARYTRLGAVPRKIKGTVQIYFSAFAAGLFKR